MKDRVLDGSLFWKTCSQCGSDFEVRHDLLYHDMKKRFCVWLKYENQFGEIELEGGAQQAGKVFEHYRLRIVFLREELNEKIKLADDGYDDIQIETIKLLHSVTNKIDIGDQFYYDRTESPLFGRKKLVFLQAHDDSEQEHSIDLLNALDAVKSYVPEIASALSSEWDPWMWVTSATILDALGDCGLAHQVKDTRTRVHVLHPSGYSLEQWVIEEEDEAARFRDEGTGDLYAITFYDRGEPKTKFVSKEDWEEARRILDNI